MRDSLTALAALVILILVAALAIPPFVDWEERRLDLEAALSRAAGIPVETRGAIELRLLPSPRMRVDGLTIGVPDGTAPSLVAQNVSAEMELTALLRGEVRFRAISVAEADLRLPMQDGAMSLPGMAQGGRDALGALAFDDLTITDLSVTTITPELGAMRRARLGDIRLGAPSLAGPWRIEGIYAGDRFRLGTGQLDENLSMQIKLVGGAQTALRYDVDARLQMTREDGRFRPELAGDMRFTALPHAAGQPDDADGAVTEPIVLSTRFDSARAGFDLSDLRLELGDPSLGSQLEGSGFLRLDDPRLSLSLEGRRLALDAIMRGERGALLASWLAGQGQGAALPPVDLSLALGSIGFAQEELVDVALRAMLEGGALQIAHSAVTLPGEGRLTFAGDLDLVARDRIAGQARLTAADGDRLARYLRRIGLEGPWLGLVRGAGLDIGGHVAIAPEGITLRDLAFRAGDAAIGGMLVYTAPQIGQRGRIEAQIRADGLDLADLPPLDGVPLTAGDTDMTIALSAEDVRYGEERGGRIDARMHSEGETLVVETFRIAGLAGAEADLSGRIAADGAGLISGRVQAARAAPLLTLLGRLQQDGLLGLAPPFIREGGVDLAVSIDRLPPERGLDAGALRLSLEGDLAGGPFSATASTLGGRIEEFRMFLATRDTRDWVDLDHPAVAGRASNATLEMRRSGSDRYAATASGDMAGLRFRTTRALSIDAITREIWDGEIQLASDDLRPALALLALGDAGLDTLPGQMRVSLSREPGASRLELDGRVAQDRVRGSLRLGQESISGELDLAALSLPPLIDTLLTNTGEAGAAGEADGAAFRPIRMPLRQGRVAITAERLGLGRDFEAREAAFDLLIRPDGLVFQDFSGSLDPGQLSGTLSLRLSPDGPLAVVGEVDFAGMPAERLLGPSPFAANLTGALEFGAAGTTLADVLADLSGAGVIILDDIAIANMAPDGVDRGLERALAEDDPLGGRRLQGHVERALDDGSFTRDAATVSATLVGGNLRLDPLQLGDSDAGEPSWRGVAAFGLADGGIDIRGTLRAADGPTGWSGPAPQIDLGWRGGEDGVTRIVDTGPLTNGVAQIVLQRELDRIEAFEREAGERTRRLEQLRMERAREQARLEWVRILEEREQRVIERRPAMLEAAQTIARERRAEREAERLAQEEARLAEEAARRAEEEAARAEAEARLRAEEAAAREAEEEARRVQEQAAEQIERERMRDDIRRLLERQRELDGWRDLFREDRPGADLDPPLQLSPPGFADPANSAP
ncbi:MAG: AsmA family protein [Salinarimonas sp.]|nr:AsmA family protein [Salinarimonas sp.]